MKTTELGPGKPITASHIVLVMTNERTGALALVRELNWNRYPKGGVRELRLGSDFVRSRLFTLPIRWPIASSFFLGPILDDPHRCFQTVPPHHPNTHLAFDLRRG